jgi:carbonic anhydrase/acetyltransferase-like protein (isoleucine patch superfamily)
MKRLLMNYQSLITPFNGNWPEIADDAFVDISARLIGSVRIEKKASIWPGAVLRADDAEIIIGKKSAVLDLCLLEAPCGHPVIVEAGALISHKACLHGATVRVGALVGIGAIVLDGAIVGEGALIGAGSLVPPGMEVPPGMLMLGQPAKPVRELKTEEQHNVIDQLKDLEAKANVYRKQIIQG